MVRREPHQENVPMPAIFNAMLAPVHPVLQLDQYSHAIAGGRTPKNDVSTLTMKLGGVVKTFAMTSCRVVNTPAPRFATRVCVEPAE